MNRSTGTDWRAGLAFCLLLGAAGALAVDQDDPAEKRQEAAQHQLAAAKEKCQGLQAPDRERCEKKAEADYIRELDEIREQAPSGAWGEGPDLEGREGVPEQRD